MNVRKYVHFGKAEAGKISKYRGKGMTRKMIKTKDVDVLNGPLLKSIITYSIPIMLGSFIQALFNSVDIAVLGNMADTTAVAAVGSTGPIVGLIVNSFVGLSGGTSIILARYIGAGDWKNTRKTVDTSIISSFFVGIIISIIGIMLAGKMLTLTRCPAECFEGAEIYLKLYFAGIPAIMVYNFGATIIRVNGDSQRPLYYLIFSGLLNVVLNIILCFILEQKVIAVAAATFASQTLGAVLVIIHLLKMQGDCRIELRRMVFDMPTFLKIMRFGIPCAFTNSLYAISNLQIQSAINDFGPEAISGNTASANIEGLVASFTGAFGVATLAFAGQNIGAGNRERVKKTIASCLLLGVCFGLVLGLGLFALGRPILSVFIPGEEEAIRYGLIRMQYVLAFYAVAAVNGVLTSSMQAFGYSIIPMISSIITILVFRLIWMTFVYPLDMTIYNLYVCFTYSWILSMLVHSASFTAVFRRYLKNKIKSI